MFKESLHTEALAGIRTVNQPEASTQPSSTEHPAWQRLRNSESYQHHLQMNAIRKRVNQGKAQEVEGMSQQGGTVWEKYKKETLENHQASSQSE
jgi:hypothetical protein